jgi:hypothetical protein
MYQKAAPGARRESPDKYPAHLAHGLSNRAKDRLVAFRTRFQNLRLLKGRKCFHHSGAGIAGSRDGVAMASSIAWSRPKCNSPLDYCVHRGHRVG